MGQKRVSFKVAKAIKEAGYPQDNPNNQYYTKDGQISDLYHYGVPYYDVDCFAPTYIDVWLWLWREKKVAVSITCNKEERWSPYGLLSSIYEDYSDPEEAIIAAINYLVENNLITSRKEMKIKDIAIDASRYYKCLNIKSRFHSLLRRVFPRHYERKLEKDIKAMRE